MMKISVAITSYNQKQYLIEAIASVLAQTLPPSQIIIVDDGSTDGSQEVIAGYKSRYPELVDAVFHAQNQGIPATRNDALKAVRGDCVTFLDGDDRFLPAKLEKEARLLEQNPAAQIAYSNHYRITETGDRIGMWAEGEPLPQGNVFRQVFVKELPRGENLVYMMVRYQAWVETGFYDPRLSRGEDYDMCIRLSKRCRVVYCHEPLSEYRKDENRVSRALLAAEKLARSHYIYRKNLHLLDDIDAAARDYIKQRISKIMKKQAKQAAEEIVQAGQLGEASQREASDYYARALKDISSLV
jgi:glycosyltransferase involved in cell wall biosynthesis